MQAMVATLIFAGLRREELLRLTHDDIDWKAAKFGLIRVRAKTIDGESWEPKTKKNRAVPVFVAEILSRQVATESRPKHLALSKPEGKRWDADNFSADLRDRNEKAKMPWGSLDFRHTFGSQLAMKGESLYQILTLMGNSPEICRRHYPALIPEALGDSVEFAAIEI